jgi:hypothetical protein
MAVVTRYFGVTGAGAADGTTWADRAALFSAGNWSTVITGFNFSGSDSLKCLIGPGTHTASQALAAGLFANAPTVANPLLLCACDGSGNLLAVPDPDWTSDQPAWDASTLPVLATTTDIATSSLANVWWYLIKFTSSGRASGSVLSNGNGINWCVVINSTSGASAAAVTASAASVMNSYFSCTGSSYDTIYAQGNAASVFNCRIQGVAGSSGNRRGITISSFAAGPIDMTTVVGCGGDAVVVTSTSASQTLRVQRSVLANNGGAGLKANSTASQLSNYFTLGCMVTGNGGWGLDGQSAARWFAAGNRLRDNTSGNFTGMGNYPTDLGNYTTDAADSDDYVDAANGDFRIKAGSAIHGMGFGVSDQPTTGGTIAHNVFGGTVVR